MRLTREDGNEVEGWLWGEQFVGCVHEREKEESLGRFDFVSARSIHLTSPALAVSDQPA